MDKFRNGINLSKFYYIVAMVKFPLVLSKNGIFNGVLSILFVGLLSTISNILISDLIRKNKQIYTRETKPDTAKATIKPDGAKIEGASHLDTKNQDTVDQINQQICDLTKEGKFDETSQKIRDDTSHKMGDHTMKTDHPSFTTYSDISSELLTKQHNLVLYSILIFRLISIIYLIDLTFKFLQGIGLISNNFLIYFFLSSLFLISSKFNPNGLVSNLNRNVFTFLLLSIVTAVFAIKNRSKNGNLINFKNTSNLFFDSFPLTFLCFAQQLGNISTLHDTAPLDCIFSGFSFSFAYISIGISGYLSYIQPELNWFKNIEIFEIRLGCSLIFAFLNILQFSVIFNTTFSNLNSHFTLSSLLVFLINGLALLIIAYCPVFLSVCCLIFSIFIMSIYPSLFYLKFKNNSKLKRLLAYGNLAVGIFLILSKLHNVAL